MSSNLEQSTAIWGAIVWAGFCILAFAPWVVLAIVEFIFARFGLSWHGVQHWLGGGWALAIIALFVVGRLRGG